MSDDPGPSDAAQSDDADALRAAYDAARAQGPAQAAEARANALRAAAEAAARAAYEAQATTTQGDDAAQPSAYERGAAKIAEVYAGDVAALPEGTMPFYDVMMRTLFAEVWDRDVLSIRDRRLLLMGVIAAQGQADVFAIQARAALRRGELSADELRECLIMLAPYAGYPNVAALVGPVEEAISGVRQETDDESA